jgi:hypothetical protein
VVTGVKMDEAMCCTPRPADELRADNPAAAADKGVCGLGVCVMGVAAMALGSVCGVSMVGIRSSDPALCDLDDRPSPGPSPRWGEEDTMRGSRELLA